MNLTFFKYQAFDSQGKVQAGQVNAESEREAIRILNSHNMFDKQSMGWAID